MKNIFLLFIGVFFVSIVLFSCKKDEDGKLIMPKMTAKTGTTTFAAVLPGATTYKDSLLTIAGLTIDKRVMNISVRGTALKTYKLATNTSITNIKGECFVIYKLTENASGSSYYVSYTSEVTITKYDAVKKLVSGTFKATMRPSSDMLTNTSDIAVTEGIFENVTLIVY